MVKFKLRDQKYSSVNPPYFPKRILKFVLDSILACSTNSDAPDCCSKWFSQILPVTSKAVCSTIPTAFSTHSCLLGEQIGIVLESLGIW